MTFTPEDYRREAAKIRSVAKEAGRLGLGSFTYTIGNLAAMLDAAAEMAEAMPPPIKIGKPIGWRTPKDLPGFVAETAHPKTKLNSQQWQGVAWLVIFAFTLGMAAHACGLR